MINDNDDTFIEQVGKWYGYERQYGLERKDFLNDLIVEIEKSLYKDGRAILYLENKFIFSKNNHNNIKTLLDKSFLGGVIYLKNYTVFVLEKNKHSVSFFRGGEFVRAFDPSEKTKPFLDVDSLIEEYKNKASKNFNYLSRKKIQAPVTGYNLQEKSIFWKPPQGSPLKECSTILNGKKVSENDIAEKGRIIRIKDLSKNASKLIIDEDPDVETSFSLSSVSKFQEIKQTALLLAKKGNKLKPTIFEYNDKPIYISSNIIALSNKKNSISHFFGNFMSSFIF